MNRAKVRALMRASVGSMLVLVALSCGGRTELRAPRPDRDGASMGGSATQSDSGVDGGDASTDATTGEAGVDASSEAGHDAAADAGADAAFDAGDASEPCTTARDCDDGAPCSIDWCDPLVGECRHTVNHAACNDGFACTVDLCDPARFVCLHTPDDARCDDGLYCNGQERCGTNTGCRSGSPVGCADSVTCTVDACDEALRSCVHDPDNTVCPLSHECDPTLGCQARAFAHSAGTLYSVRLPSGRVQEIGPFSTQITDVALHPTGVLYGISFERLYSIDPTTAVLTEISTASLGSINALDAAPDGTLYAAGGQTVYTLDRGTGTATPFATLPSGSRSSGDLAFLEGRLLITTTGLAGTGDEIVEIDTVARTTTVVGSVGYDCVYGLAAFGPTLYGMTCAGLVLGIDEVTGLGTELSRGSVVFWGGSAR